MARIVYFHPSLTHHQFHVYTDLDFWDARRLLKDLAEVRRNFGKYVDGDEYPTQVIADDVSKQTIHLIVNRLKKAVPSPARHMIVRSMVFDGVFEFDPAKYYPKRWSREKMMHFTYRRLPLDQSALTTPFLTVQLSWAGEKIRVQRIHRDKKHEEVVRTAADARRRLIVPSCF